MNKMSLLIFACAQIITLKIYAQKVPHCGNVTAQENLLKEHPELREKITQLETQMNIAAQIKVKETRSAIIIPVVFHIIHNNGPENISDAQILNAVKVINDDYNELNADRANTIPQFDSLVANCGFQFKLATKDPQGKCTNGIERIQSYKTYYANDQSKLNPWNPNYYLNIWVVNSLGVDGNVAAYAYKPPTANFIPQYDGVISLYDYVGAIGASSLNNQHTLSHEIGHWLNLDHTWGSTNNPGVNCGDDGVSDTPITKGHYGSCPLNDSWCSPPKVENVQNFMEYAYCSTMFTLGQKNRMESALSEVIANRKLLYSQQSLAATGCLLQSPNCAPHTEFISNSRFACVGTTVTLTATSWGAPSINHVWASDNAIFSAPNGNVTTVTFQTPGWKEIKLKSNSITGSDSLIKTNYIYVADNSATVDPTLTETFNHQTDRDKWTLINNFENYFKWEHTSQVGLWGPYSIMYRAFDDRSIKDKQTLTVGGDIDDIITPTYNLINSAPNNKYFNFMMANAALDGFVNEDTLLVDYSKNCGMSWSNLKKIFGPDLHNNGFYYSGPFIPQDDAHWKRISVSLPSAAITNSTSFRIRFKPCNKSNNLYLDNFTTSMFPTSTIDITKNNNLINIYPNPSNGIVYFSMNTESENDCQYKIMNALGSVIYEGRIPKSASNLSQWMHNFASYSNGLYFINIKNEQSSITNKFIISK
jgi:hypothetical protein